MFPRCHFFQVVCAVLFATSALCEAARKSEVMDKVLEKLASGMLQEYPNLRNGERRKVAKMRLVKEFRHHKADEIAAPLLKKIRRKKADFENVEWKNLVTKAERAQLQGERCRYLLDRAKVGRLNRLEQYVAQRLLEEYLEVELEERTLLAKSQLRKLGRMYSQHLKETGKAPLSLDEWVGAEATVLNPLTGESEAVVYVGAGPELMKGSNNYKVVAYCPFPIGKRGSKLWVVYKGGRVAEWKAQTLIKKHERLIAKNAELFSLQKKATERKGKRRINPKSEVAQKLGNELQGGRQKSEPLKITIKEIW